MNAKPRVPLGLAAALLLVALLCVSCGATTVETSSPGTAPTAGVASTTGSTPTTGPTLTTGPTSNTEPTPTTLLTPSTVPASSATPLLSLLGRIPEDPISQTEDFVYFVDYSAMESAYGATRPADAEEFSQLETSEDSTKIWWVVFRESAWSYSQYWLKSLETGPEMVGFSPLEIDKAMRFGVPPGFGLMLAGDFRADAIRAAYQTNIGLASKEFDGTTVWLWGEDPADGFLVDTANVVQDNPFGGELGRRQPMIISDDLLMSSADLGLVLAHAGAAAGTVPSLADTPGYRAAVDAVAEDATLLQAAIAGPVMALSVAFQPMPPPDGLLSPGTPGSTSGAGQETPGSASGTPPADRQELPAFQLLILADVVTGDEQIARLGLVYPDAGTAETAGAVLLDRLATHSSLTGDSFATLLTPADGTGPRYHVRQESDQAVLVLEFPAPKAPVEEIVKMVDKSGYLGTATTPGMIYRRLLNMFARRDTGWLSAGPGPS